MWNLIGLAASLGLALLAWRRVSRDTGNPFQRDFYAMGSGEHRGYAVAGLGFAALFAAGLMWSAVPTIPILAVFTVAAILYGASFVRGASGEDE